MRYTPRACIVVFLMLCTNVLHAQLEATDYARIGHAGFLASVVTDYQCVGINPANLGFIPTRDVYSYSTPLASGSEYSRKRFAITLGEGGLSLNSNALSKAGLLDLLLQRGSAVRFSQADKLKAAQLFAGRGLRFSADVTPFAFAFQHESIGGFALSVRERIHGTFVLNDEAAKLMFQGRHSDYFDSTALNWRGDTIGYSRNPKKFSEVFNGTNFSLVWLREFALSYGIQVFDDGNTSVYIGVSPKFVQAYAYMEARATSGNLLAQSALSPYFAINYGKATTPSAIAGNALVPVGQGYGFDGGVTVKYNDWSFSSSIIDVGTVTYNGNVFAAGDTVLNNLGSEGFDSYNLFTEAPKITGEGEYFRWSGLLSASSRLPMRMRVGASWQQNKRWSYGVDCLVPLNETAGSLEGAFVSAGVDWRPTDWLNVGLGTARSQHAGVTVPVSFMFTVFNGRWQLGLSTLDASTLFASSNPALSAIVGVARVRW